MCVESNMFLCLLMLCVLRSHVSSLKYPIYLINYCNVTLHPVVLVRYPPDQPYDRSPDHPSSQIQADIIYVDGHTHRHSTYSK